jgi:hypothetical protein
MRGGAQLLTAYSIGAGGVPREIGIGVRASSGMSIAFAGGQAGFPVSETVTAAGQRTSMTVPPASVCQGRSGVLAVGLSSKRAGGGAALKLKQVAAYFDKIGRKPVAVSRSLPATEYLPLARLAFGKHQLLLVFTWGRHGHPSTTRKVKAGFSVCDLA